MAQAQGLVGGVGGPYIQTNVKKKPKIQTSMSYKHPSVSSVSKARASLAIIQMEKSLIEERKKAVKTTMKEKKETRNLNFKSSDSVERFRKVIDLYPNAGE